MSFVDKIYQLGWLEPGRYEDDKSGLLVRSVVRYHGFLDVSPLWTSEGSALILILSVAHGRFPGTFCSSDIRH